MVLNKLFVNVPNGKYDAALVASTQTSNSKKIYFFEDGRIVSNGKEYSIPTASFDDVKNRIKAVEDLIKADGGTIDKVNEVLAWFAGINTTDPIGTALVADVAANKTGVTNSKAKLDNHEARMLAAEADIEAIKAEDKVHTTVTDNTGNYVKVSTAADTKVVTVTENVVTLENATDTNTGIADAYNVKQYVDAAKISAQEYIDTYDFWETFE